VSEDVYSTDDEGIRQLIPEISGQCSVCGGAGRIPEDVLAVTVGDNGQVLTRLIMCERCTNSFVDEQNRRRAEGGDAA